jgi:hypothetical protein
VGEGDNGTHEIEFHALLPNGVHAARHLRGHHTEHFNGDTIELVEATPGTGLAQTLEAELRVATGGGLVAQWLLREVLSGCWWRRVSFPLCLHSVPAVCPRLSFLSLAPFFFSFLLVGLPAHPPLRPTGSGTATGRPVTNGREATATGRQRRGRRAEAEARRRRGEGRAEERASYRWWRSPRLGALAVGHLASLGPVRLSVPIAVGGALGSDRPTPQGCTSADNERRFCSVLFNHCEHDAQTQLRLLHGLLE